MSEKVVIYSEYQIQQEQSNSEKHLETLCSATVGERSFSQIQCGYKAQFSIDLQRYDIKCNQNYSFKSKSLMERAGLNK